MRVHQRSAARVLRHVGWGGVLAATALIAFAGGIEATGAHRQVLEEELRAAGVGVDSKSIVEAARNSEKPSIREVAIELLALDKDPEAIEVAKEALDDSAEQVRVVAAWALGYLGDPTGVSLLRAWMDQPQTSFERLGIAIRLADLGDAGGCSALTDEIGLGDEAIQMLALEPLQRLVRVEGCNALNELFRLARSRIERVRLSAVGMLAPTPFAELPAERVIPFLVVVKRSDPAGAVRSRAAMMLERWEESTPNFEGLRSIEVEEEAEAILAQPMVVESMPTPPWPESRETLERRLGQSEPTSSDDELMAIVQSDRALGERRDAVRLLALVGGAGTRDFLTHVLKSSSDFELQLGAAWGLGLRGESSGVETLRRLLTETPDPLNSLRIAGSLAELGDPGGLATAIQSATSESAPVRFYAAKVLGPLMLLMEGREAGAMALSRLMTDADASVRYEALAAIERNIDSGVVLPDVATQTLNSLARQEVRELSGDEAATSLRARFLLSKAMGGKR